MDCKFCKIFIIFTILFSLTLPSRGLAYLAKVNNEVITVEDFKKALSSAHMYTPLRKDKAGKLSKKIIKETLDNMIDHYLLAQEAQRLNLDKEPDYLKNLDYYKKDLATRAFWQEEFKKIKITDEELKSYYQEKNTKWHFSQIFTKNKKRAQEALKRLRAGEPFPKVARELSESPYASRGGDLGFIRKGQMVKEWEKVAFSLEPGEFSNIIKTSQGFHIVKLEEIKLPDMKTFEQRKKSIRRELTKKRRKIIEKQWEDSLRAKANIKINQELFKQIKQDFKGKDEEIIAWVNGAPIYLKEFLSIFKRKLWGYNAMKERWNIKIDLNKVKKEILDGLINQKVIEQEAIKRDYFSKNQEIKKQLDNHKRMLLIKEFKRKIIAPQIVLSEKGLKDYYKEHKQAYLSPNQYNLRLIRVKSKKEAQEILEELKAGGDFAFLAKKKSSAESAKKGGAIGWHSENRLPTKIREAVKELKPGEFSPIVEDGGYYSIVFLEEKKEGKPIPFEEVKEKVKRQLWTQKFNTLLNKYLKQLRKVSDIKLDKKALNKLEEEFGIK